MINIGHWICCSLLHTAQQLAALTHLTWVMGGGGGGSKHNNAFVGSLVFQTGYESNESL